MKSKPFSGSYDPEDVTFLLTPISIVTTNIEDKERLIQSGKRHYSEMISEEKLPSPEYLTIFQSALSRNKHRMAQDLITLATAISEIKSNTITIVSLARAGTPVGVLLLRILRTLMKIDVQHYSISIIRDRGIDTNALSHILTTEKRPAESIVFVDGWTGKGVISEVLHDAIDLWNKEHSSEQIDSRLFVLADLAGCAGLAATNEDYLIPSSILNSTVSGLTSRSILNSDYISDDDFHGCVFYEEWLSHDLSRLFIEEVFSEIKHIWATNVDFTIKEYNQEKTSEISRNFIAKIMEEFEIKNRNLIKPGIGEATRVLLRRVPNYFLVKNLTAEDVQHAIILANEKEIPILVRPDMPYAAVALIKPMELE